MARPGGVAAADRWSVAAPLPRGANHVGVAVLDSRLYAIGGFVEQNRRPHGECFSYEFGADRWAARDPLPSARAGGGPVMGGGVQSAVHEAFALA
ncbi:MAG: hypothetical protein KJZ83_09805 [Burkholderiaceae bacterium]|nr:hypothetical protein [Burkholderiaceae bacterium]